MKYKSLTFLNLIIISFFLISSASAQIEWDLNTEGGLFTSTNKLIIDSKNILLRIDGNVKYSYSDEDYSTTFKLRARPEFYGINNFSSTKIKAMWDFNKGEELIDWGINLTGQKNFYHNSLTSFNYNIFMLSANFNWYHLPENPISAQVGYAYQTTSENIEQYLDLIFLNTKIFYSFFSYSKTGIGIYVEKFIIENNFLNRFVNSETTNKGWRFGPQISFDYQDKEILNLEYRFLFHASQVTKSPSYEQSIRFIAGRIFLDYWSFFILADYYDRHFSFKEDNTTQENLAYNPLDVENRINLKLAYELNDYSEIYFKSGYFKEIFFDNSYNFDGWNILIGFEISN